MSYVAHTFSISPALVISRSSCSVRIVSFELVLLFGPLEIVRFQGVQLMSNNACKFSTVHLEVF